MSYTKAEMKAAELYQDRAKHMSNLIRFYPKVGDCARFERWNGEIWDGIITYVGFGKLMLSVTRNFARLEIEVDMTILEVDADQLHIYECPKTKIRECEDAKTVWYPNPS